VAGQTTDRNVTDDRSEDMTQTSVFVVYGASDDALATQLIEALREAGADVVVHPVESDAEDFVSRLEAVITRCEWVMLLLSADALASPQVDREMTAVKWLRRQGYFYRVMVIETETGRERAIPEEWYLVGLDDYFDDVIWLARWEFHDSDGNFTPERLYSTCQLTQEPDDDAAPPNQRAQALVAEGVELVRKGKFPVALPRLERALQLDPEGFERWTEFAKALNRVGRYADALEAAGRAIGQIEKDDAFAEDDPSRKFHSTWDERSAWNEKGEALEGLGRLQDALEAYSRAARDDSSLYGTPFYGKARVLRALGRDAEADAANAIGESLEDAQNGGYPF
jgi:tetratricopeptide (TPR) repeat protein